MEEIDVFLFWKTVNSVNFLYYFLSIYEKPQLKTIDDQREKHDNLIPSWSDTACKLGLPLYEWKVT